MIRRFLSLSRQEREAMLYTKKAQFLERLARELEALGPATATQAVEAIAASKRAAWASFPSGDDKGLHEPL
jgi:stage V sporulation protein SpoVS